MINYFCFLCPKCRKWSGQSTSKGFEDMTFSCKYCGVTHKARDKRKSGTRIKFIKVSAYDMNRSVAQLNGQSLDGIPKDVGFSSFN